MPSASIGCDRAGAVPELSAKFAGLAPIGTRTGAERVAGQLMDLVRSGNVRAGDRLPTERELAQAFGVSRPIVREAMRSLAILGVIETRQGGRCYVTDLTVPRLMGPLRFVISLDASNVEALHQARLLIETGLARQAALLLAPEAAARLREMAEAFPSLVGDPVAFRLLDQNFHALINEAAGNPFLSVVASSLYELGMDFRRAASEAPGVLERSAAEHRAIVAALEARDADGAAAAMAAHLASIHVSTVRAMAR